MNHTQSKLRKVKVSLNEINLRTFRMFFNSKMVVTEQFWSYGFMSYIAETGGFVGLFLGFSLLQLEEVLLYLAKLWKSGASENDEKKENIANTAKKPDAFDLVFNLKRFPNNSRKRNEFFQEHM